MRAAEEESTKTGPTPNLAHRGKDTQTHKLAASKHEKVQQLFLEQHHEAAVSPSRARLSHSLGLSQANTHPCPHTLIKIPHTLNLTRTLYVAHWVFHWLQSKQKKQNKTKQKTAIFSRIHRLGLKACVFKQKLRCADLPALQT